MVTFVNLSDFLKIVSLQILVIIGLCLARDDLMRFQLLVQKLFERVILFEVVLDIFFVQSFLVLFENLLEEEGLFVMLFVYSGDFLLLLLDEQDEVLVVQDVNLRLVQ